MLVAVVEGSRGNLEARLVRNAENKEDVEGVSAAVVAGGLLHWSTMLVIRYGINFHFQI